MLLLRSPLTYVWMFLVVTTAVSWWLGAHGIGASMEAASNGSLDVVVTVGIMLIALIKTRFVIWHFMEVRHAPSWLRWTCDSWLVVLAIVVLALYSVGS